MDLQYDGKRDVNDKISQLTGTDSQKNEHTSTHPIRTIAPEP